MRLAIVLFTLTLASILCATADARTSYIKPDGTGDYPTIQDGINAAATDDIVLLAAGTYTGAGNRDIDFLGKAITVISESGRDVTVIDCQGLGRGLVFQSGEGSSSILSGVTIRNGTANYGGGIYCYNNSSPTISGNAISGNVASTWGGGIFCRNSSAIISGNTISGNSANNGGGISSINSSYPAISGNTISGNSGSYGGGIYCNSASPTISGNTISGNTTGGGIYCDYGSFATINSTVVAFNVQGPGIACRASFVKPTLTNCDVYGNEGGDALCGTDGGGNISADPLFCAPGAANFYLNCTSPCVNNPGYGQIGAFGAGCGPTAIERTTWGRLKSIFR